MARKTLSLSTNAILLAILCTLACTLLLYKSSYAAPGATTTARQAHTMIPGSSVVPLDSMDVKAIAAVSSRDIWIAGSYSSPSGQPQGFYEHFDGLQWQVVDTHIGERARTSSAIESLSAVSSNDIWAVGSYADGALIEHWNGQNWSLADKNVTNNSDLKSVLALSSNNVWAVGERYDADGFNSTTLIKHFDGSSWSVVYSPSVGTKSSLNSITAVSSNELWAVGSSYDTGTITEHYIGGNWSLVPDPNAHSQESAGAASLNSTAALSANDVWAVGATNSGQGHLLTEHWNGQSWSIFSAPMLSDSNQSLTSVIALRPKNVWAMGSYEDATSFHPFVIRWDGSEWDTVPLPDNLTRLNAWQQLGHSNTLIGIGTYDKQIRLLTIPAIF